MIDSLYSRPMKILFEMYAYISTFRLSPISFKIGEMNQKLYIKSLHRQRSVSVLLGGVKNDTGSNNFYVIQLFDRDEQQLKNFDKLMGDFLAGLKEKGQYEDAIIVIMSDHGFNPGPWPSYGVEAEPTWRLYKVPFAIKTPGAGAGKLHEYIAQSIDIAPTLLAQVLTAEEYGRLRFDGVDVLRQKPRRKHYINLGKKDVMYRLGGDKGGKPKLIEVPLSQIKLAAHAE